MCVIERERVRERESGGESQMDVGDDVDGDDPVDAYIVCLTGRPLCVRLGLRESELFCMTTMIMIIHDL